MAVTAAADSAVPSSGTSARPRPAFPSHGGWAGTTSTGFAAERSTSQQVTAEPSPAASTATAASGRSSAARISRASVFPTARQRPHAPPDGVPQPPRRREHRIPLVTRRRDQLPHPGTSSRRPWA